ncbi:putative non-specific serine/threonine protein kinase [Helianthus annuus]|nr:putative non-specific serine/threonine protein kinase [Helianthus annuus]
MIESHIWTPLPLLMAHRCIMGVEGVEEGSGLFLILGPGFEAVVEGRKLGYVAVVGNLSFLRGLSLANNSFQGAIPRELGRLFRLRFLYLNENKFNGGIPNRISSCSNLEELEICFHC